MCKYIYNTFITVAIFPSSNFLTLCTTGWSEVLLTLCTTGWSEVSYFSLRSSTSCWPFWKADVFETLKPVSILKKGTEPICGKGQHVSISDFNSQLLTASHPCIRNTMHHSSSINTLSCTVLHAFCHGVSTCLITRISDAPELASATGPLYTLV